MRDRKIEFDSCLIDVLANEVSGHPNEPAARGE